MARDAPAPALTDVDEIRRRLRALGNARDAAFLQRFFKTGRGEYAEGDVFIGMRVPATRKLAARCGELSVTQLVELLRSRIHEERLLALILMVRGYARDDETARKALYTSYLANTDQINNWDLVDASAEHILGA